MKISWIGPWVSRIDQCEGQTIIYKLSGFEAVRHKLKNGLKTQKMHFFACFRAYVGQPHDHKG